MEIDCKEQKALKMTIQIPLVQLITLQIIRKSHLSQKGLPRIVAVNRKRPAWSRDTLQDAEGMQIYGIDEPYHEEQQMAPPVVRQVAPPCTSSKGSRV